jgi:hypothetical protein
VLSGVQKVPVDQCHTSTSTTLRSQARTSETLPNFDIVISRYRSYKLRFRSSENGFRYRVRYYTWISRFYTFDIKGVNSEKPRYRRHVASISKQYDIEETSFRTSILLCRDIDDIEECTFDILLSVSKLCASISTIIFFDVGVSLSNPVWTAVTPA